MEGGLTMAQYIERAKVTDALIDNTSIVGDELEEAVNAICAIPAADVRHVVTCIECKHSCDMPGGLRCCCGTCLDCYVEPEFFCADGEREES
jgi:hypothetical protein